jgi:hypothetical protein
MTIADNAAQRDNPDPDTNMNMNQQQVDNNNNALFSSCTSSRSNASKAEDVEARAKDVEILAGETEEEKAAKNRATPPGTPSVAISSSCAPTVVRT